MKDLIEDDHLQFDFNERKKKFLEINWKNLIA